MLLFNNNEDDFLEEDEEEEELPHPIPDQPYNEDDFPTHPTTEEEEE